MPLLLLLIFKIKITGLTLAPKPQIMLEQFLLNREFGKNIGQVVDLIEPQVYFGELGRVLLELPT